MIQTLFDAKRLIADIHNSILKSIESKDTELRRQAIYLLRDAFEDKNFSIAHNFSDEIGFESKETFPDDWSSTGKRHHQISRSMNFNWIYTDEDSATLKKGWNIILHITRREYYKTHEGYYSDCLGFFISWSVNLKRWYKIDRSMNERKFEPKN